MRTISSCRNWASSGHTTHHAKRATGLQLSRRELLAGAGASAAALLLEPRAPAQAQAAPGRAGGLRQHHRGHRGWVQHDVALAVVGDKIAAIGPTDDILKSYPQADATTGAARRCCRA